ncbi:uncharacterized protein LOC111703706 [Eurytemora carolleeae]|uniref:uncharacterized protein LOC111703706 n=1 Tax=Eurytemora carolleeae TaxID=1294199 RepID=UPI000C784CC8|nr:uncharacterized protein LOC111703706 [Eurytemora carolleeae]|eukprot:XP_023331503.1 uncharacterized protein LOC111703706 [Eurytemora affinis]
MQFEIFVHQTGLFSSGLEVMVSRDWINYDTVALINAKQLTQIANDSLCSDQKLFDQCKEKYLLGVVNDTIGCTPRNSSIYVGCNSFEMKQKSYVEFGKATNDDFKTGEDTCLLPCTISLIQLTLFSQRKPKSAWGPKNLILRIPRKIMTIRSGFIYTVWEFAAEFGGWSGVLLGNGVFY